MRRICLPLALALGLAACGGSERSGQGAEARVDSTAIARAAFDPAIFDTIAWKSDQEAEERGAVVYRFSCQKCHGEEGLGDGGFVRGGEILHPGSFLDPAWAWAEDKEGLREQVFVGTDEGMPHWGLAGLKARDVDAVAIYIIRVLRKDL